MSKFKLGKVLTGGLKHAVGIPLSASEKHETGHFKEAMGSSNAVAEQARQQAAQAAAAEQARQQAEVARAQAQAEQREAESQRVAAIQIQAAQEQHRGALQRETMARAQQEASDAEAKALQAQLDAALKAKKVVDMKLQLAQLNQAQPEPSAAAKPADVEPKNAQQEEDSALERALAESLSLAEQPAAAPSSPPSYEEVVDRSIMDEVLRSSKTEAEEGIIAQSQINAIIKDQPESAAAGANSATTAEVHDESLDSAIAMPLSDEQPIPATACSVKATNKISAVVAEIAKSIESDAAREHFLAVLTSVHSNDSDNAFFVQSMLTSFLAQESVSASGLSMPVDSGE